MPGKQIKLSLEAVKDDFFSSVYGVTNFILKAENELGRSLWNIISTNESSCNAAVIDKKWFLLSDFPTKDTRNRVAKDYYQMYKIPVLDSFDIGGVLSDVPNLVKSQHIIRFDFYGIDDLPNNRKWCWERNRIYSQSRNEEYPRELVQVKLTHTGRCSNDSIYLNIIEPVDQKTGKVMEIDEEYILDIYMYSKLDIADDERGKTIKKFFDKGQHFDVEVMDMVVLIDNGNEYE